MTPHGENREITQHAILANPRLTWRQLNSRTAEVATEVSGVRIAVRLLFNQQGEIEQTIAERPRLEAGGAVTPWIGGYSDYRGADDPLPALRP